MQRDRYDVLADNYDRRKDPGRLVMRTGPGAWGFRCVYDGKTEPVYTEEIESGPPPKPKPMDSDMVLEHSKDILEMMENPEKYKATEGAKELEDEYMEIVKKMDEEQKIKESVFSAKED